MRTLFLITFFALHSFSLWAVQDIQQPTKYTREDCQQLIDDAKKDTSSKNYVKALEKLLKADLMATQNQWNDELWRIYNDIGLIYLYISNYAEALEYFQKSLEIIQKEERLSYEKSTPLANVGFLYAKEEKYTEALYYFEKAYDIIKEQNDEKSSRRKKNLTINLAITYNKLNTPEKSFEVLEKVKKEVGVPKIDFLWEVIYISTLLKSGQVEQAQNKGEKLFAELNTLEDFRDECYICLVSTLSEIYFELNKLDLSIAFTKKGLSKNNDLAYSIELYDQAAKAYHKKGDYQMAYSYIDSVVIYKDSLSISINKSQYEANKVKFKIEEYKNDLNKEREKKGTQQKLFAGLALIGLIVFLSVYRGLRNRVVKQKQKTIISSLELEKEKKEHQLAEKQKLLIEKELETTKLKQQHLKHKVAEKNRKLTAKALYFTKRNKLIQDIIHTIEINRNKTDNKEVAKQIRSIKNILKADDYQEDFMNHFESVNPYFLKRLKEKHPKLTSNDTRFLCYVFMNLNLKEISSVFNITYNAAEIRKRRIKEKIGLNKKASLYDYMISIED